MRAAESTADDAARARTYWGLKRWSAALRVIAERLEHREAPAEFLNDEEIGPRMLARIAKRTGLTNARPSTVRRRFLPVMLDNCSRIACLER